MDEICRLYICLQNFLGMRCRWQSLETREANCGTAKAGGNGSGNDEEQKQ